MFTFFQLPAVIRNNFRDILIYIPRWKLVGIVLNYIAKNELHLSTSLFVYSSWLNRYTSVEHGDFYNIWKLKCFKLYGFIKNWSLRVVQSRYEYPEIVGHVSFWMRGLVVRNLIQFMERNTTMMGHGSAYCFLIY